MTTYYLPFDKSINLGQPYGARPGQFPNPPGGHNGDDWLTAIGTPVRSPGYGTVIFAGTFDTTYADNFGWNINYGGNMVVLNMDGDLEPYFEFAHLSEFRVKAGDRVVPGQIIALTGNSDGNTGVSTGAHCHVGCLPYNFVVSDKTYGRVNPRLFMTKYWDNSISTQSATIESLEEEEEMLVIARDTSASNPEAVWIGNGLHRRHVPDQATLKAMQNMASWGMLKIFKNGEVQNLPTSAIGTHLEETIPVNMMNVNIPRQGVGLAIGKNTNLGAVLSWSDSNTIGVLDAIKATASENGASVEEIIDAMKASLAAGIKLDFTANIKS